MQQMQFPRIFAILEGAMERAFVNNNFSYVHVMPISNGITWSVDAMLKQILTLIETINCQYDLIVVWFDREKRTETALEIANAIENGLCPEIVPMDKLAVVVCDQMTENLFLLDGDLMRDEGISEGPLFDSVGQNGKAILKQLLRSSKRNYSETFDGVKMLKKLNLGNVRESTQCVDGLLLKIPPCWWGGAGQ